MPNYIVNGKKYQVPEDKASGFEKKYPDAQIEYNNEGKTYRIPLEKREGFLKKFPGASPDSENTPAVHKKENTTSSNGDMNFAYGAARVGHPEMDDTKPVSKESPSVGAPPVVDGITHEEEKAYSDVSNRRITDRDMQLAKARTNAAVAQTQKIIEDTKENIARFKEKKPFSVVETKLKFNPESGKIEAKRENESGQDVYAMTEQKLSTDITPLGKMRRAQRRKENLQRRLREREASLNADRKKGEPVVVGSDFAQMGLMLTNPGTAVVVDDEAAALREAIKSTDEEIAVLGRQIDRERGEESGFWRGFNGDWANRLDFGFGDLAGLRVRMNAGGDKTEDALSAEQEMLKSDAMKADAESLYKDEAMYKYGNMAAEMIPFMIDFLASGGITGGIRFGAGAGAKLAAKTFGKEALEEMTKMKIRQYLKTYGWKGARQLAGNWAIKATGATADDLAKGFVMANTVQGAKTAASIGSEYMGDVQHNKVTGQLEYAKDGDLSNAIWQKEASATIENFSEMFGVHLDKAVNLENMAKLANVFGAKRVSDFLVKASKDELVGFMGYTQKFLEKLGISGYGGEVTEEYYGQLWRTMLGLDEAYMQNPDGSRTNLFASGEFHKDVIVGLGLSMGLMGAGNVGVSSAMYAKAKHNQNKSDIRLQQMLGEEWEGLRMVIDMTTNENVADVIGSIVQDAEFTPREKNAILDYVGRSLYLRGINLADNINGREQSEAQKEANQSYIDGYHTTSKEDMVDAHNMYMLQRMKIVDTLGEDVATNIGNNPDAALANLGEDEKTDNMVIDFINAMQVYEGVMQRQKDSVEEMVSRSSSMVDSRTNIKTGKVMKAAAKDGRVVYVVNGNVQADEASGVIDETSSDGTIIVRDAATGKLEQMSPDALSSIESNISAEDEKTAAADAANQMYIQQIASVEGQLPFAVGDKYTTMDDSRTAHEVEILSNNGDGTVMVAVDGVAQNEAVPTDVIQQEATTFRMNRIAEYESAREEEEAEEEDNTSQPASYEVGSEVLLGGSIRGEIVDETDGEYTIDLAEPIEGQYTITRTKDELDEMTGNSVQEEEIPQEVVEIPEEEEEEMDAIEEEIAPSSEVAEETVEDAKTNATALERIPLNEQGEPAYDQTDAETAWDAIMEQTEGDSEMAAAVVASTIADKQKALDDAQTAEIPQGATVQEKIAAQKAHKQNIENAQKELAHWQEIAGVESKRAEMAAHENNVVSKMQESYTEAVKAAESETETNPTEKQKEAGNYKKGHVKIGAFNITIEQPKGSVRRGVDANGNKWETEMQNTYGYIRGTEGVDGDHIDVFLSDNVDNWNGEKVFVVDQYNEDGTFDEHKVMLGFNDANDAEAAYLSNYEKGWAENRKIVISSVGSESFEKWINSSHRKTKPFAEYKDVKNNAAQENASFRTSENQGSKEVKTLGKREKLFHDAIDRWNEVLGVKVKIVHGIDEVTNRKAREQLMRERNTGESTKGWIDSEGNVVIYAPNIESTDEIAKTVMHEVVAHYGMEGLFGKKNYKNFCEKVWYEHMTLQQRRKFSRYPGVNGNRAKAADEYIAHLAEENVNRSTLSKIYDAIRATLRAVGVNLELTENDIRALLYESRKRLEKNAKKGEVLSEDDASASISESGEDAAFSIKTYEDEGRSKLIKYVKSRVKSGNLTQKDGEDIVQQMDQLYEVCKTYTDKYEPFGQWSYASVVRGENGKPVFSVIKSNGDYAMNLDFSLVCKKRRTLDAVFREMINRGVINEYELGQVDIAAINKVLRDFGFETACRLCFVDAKRFRVAAVADEFCNMYNPLTKMTDRQLKKVSKEEGSSVRGQIARMLLVYPENRIELSRANFMESKGFENVKANKEEIMKLYNSKKGTGGPKASFGDVQYLNDIEAKQWTPENAYEVGGVRLQSFSDYVPRMVLDYIQMVADLAAKKLPVHAYTKEPIFAKQFGLTGIKINLSLVPRVDADGVAPGLDKDGNYAWQEGETFPYEEAIAIQNAEGYKENVGTIAVGVSDEHIEKLLSDDNIRMVIPYHKSGLNKAVAIYNNIDQFVDYTDAQNTRDANGVKLAKGVAQFNYNADLLTHGNPKLAAQHYLDWCKENNYIPKFDQFASHPNYYKLLEDFTTCITENGVDTFVPQHEVTMTFPTSESAFGSITQLIEEGLEEDAILEAKRQDNLADVVDAVEDVLRQRAENADAEESQVSFKVVEDPMKVAELEAGEKIEAYRSAYINENGKLYSPMASRLKSTQKGTKQQKNEAAQMGQWDEAVENPGMVDTDGRITILDEDNGSTKVAYNPYGHCCVNSKMNDQFKRAWKRDNLYTVKVVAPASELTDGYKADHAKDGVGVHRWKTGAVGNQLPDSKRREILLTRWMKNVEVLPWEDVAQDWIQTLEGEDVDVPFNVVPRKILNMLAEGGVTIVAPESGMESAAEAYEQWLADPEGYVGDTALPEHIQKLNKGVKGNLNNTYTYQEWKEKEGDVSFSVKKKAPKTELPEDKSSFKGSVVSDADRAKVLNNLDILQKEYEENSSKRQKTFISDLSRALLLRNNGNNSNYADYIAVSGEEVTIRLSDHNVSVTEMDNAGKSNGISIVIGRKHNDGIKGFGNSHIIEFYYNNKKLHSAEGNPYTEIIKSLKQTVYSGEYKDTTGLAERQEVNGISFRIGRNEEFSNENNDIRFRFTEEEQGIIDEAKKNGTYMKAPNGKPTNLNEKQWAQVRTKAFKEWFGDWENDPANASKIIDENGEPMVVYHDTNSTVFINKETGENWDELDWQKKEEWDNRDDWEDYWEEQDFYVFDNKYHGRRSVEMPAYFFTPNYDKYHEYGKRTIAAFLNIRNPKFNPDIQDRGVTNTAGEEAMNKLIEEGYDGFIRTEDGKWYETNAFDPNQIKSATENSGEFSKENNDIRFSVKNGRTTQGWLTKNLVEENFGGIWIEDKKEFAKFASAIIKNGIEENGEGVTYTDNFFYAYYRNINGDAIPFVSVHLNSQESQDVVDKVNKEIGNGREKRKIKKFIDTAIKRIRDDQSEDYGYNGNNSGVSNRGGNGGLGSDLLRKGRYYDNPGLYVKTERADRFGLIDEEDSDLSFRTAPSFKDGEQLPIQGEKGAYFVEGLTGDYQNADYLLDAFRSKYPEYLAEVNEDKTAIVVEPWSKYLGPATSKRAQAKQDAHRERVAKSVKQAVRDAAEKLNIPVALTTSDKQKGKRAKAKGWYDTKTHEIVIVVDNHSSVHDALATVLHEGVAHYGLRKMFGSNFDNFLDNVFKDADKAVRQRIVDLAAKNGWNFREATEEYLASLAEDADFENAVNQGWFHKIKKFFFHMLSDLGIADAHLFPIGDNELRYILWRSYENLKNPLSMHNVFTTAEDVVIQNRLMVGPYAKEMARIQSLGKVSTSELIESRGYVAEGVAGNSKNSDLRFSVAQTGSSSEKLNSLLHELTNGSESDFSRKVEAIRTITDELKRIVQGMEAGMVSQKVRSSIARQREYDMATVNRIVAFARAMLNDASMGDYTRGEVKRLLGIVGSATGRKDLMKAAKGIADTIIVHQLREMEKILKKQVSVKGSKVNASGVVVASKLDIDGARLISAVKEGMNMSPETLAENIAKAMSGMASDNMVEKRNAMTDYQGYMLAKRYQEDIKASEEEEGSLKKEIREEREKFYDFERVPVKDEDGNPILNKDGSERTTEVMHIKPEYRNNRSVTDHLNEFVGTVEDSIRENRLERLDAYAGMIAELYEPIRESMERNKEWKEHEAERISRIYHDANRDTEGVPYDEHSKPGFMAKMKNWSIVRFIFKPLATFDTMLRFFGKHNTKGQGYLWNRFMRQYTEAADKEWKALYSAYKVLDEKVSEVFGKKMKWSELYSMERNMPTGEVSFMDGGEMKTHKLTQGNLLYIYMVNKMADGRMKLRKMGITEDDVEAVREFIDPRFIEIADWIQDEFLVQKREEYNAVHERLFGASMSNIENYFPLVINSRSRMIEEDLGMPQSSSEKPSTITGSIIKRRRNTTALDITNADAFNVVIEHLQRMENWAAFAEMNNDLNALLSYNTFRNKVMNMESLRYGSGSVLWQNFKDVCAIAAGAYRPLAHSNSLDAVAVNVARGVTAAKISFRLFTALKQIASFPTFAVDADLTDLFKPTVWVKAFNWAIETLPGFAERWQSRTAGDVRLKDTDLDWSYWKNKFVRKAGEIGMTPNAFVDAIVVAVGSYAVYKSAKRRYLNDGYTEVEAHEKALLDAAVSYNETQQSNQNAYLSPMQLDRTVASTAMTTYLNSQFAFTRRYINALFGLKQLLTPGYKYKSIDFVTSQMINDGFDEDAAREIAKKLFRRALYKNIADVVMFGFLAKFIWEIVSNGVYLILGDDDKEKKKMIMDAAMTSASAGVEGLTLGGAVGELYGMAATGQDISNYQFNLLPIMSDIQNTLNKLGYDKATAYQDALNILIQAVLGINPQTFSDVFVAVLDYANGEPATAKEAALLFLRIIQAPQSQIDRIYAEEVGKENDEGRKLMKKDLLDRFVAYKFNRTTPLLKPLYDDETRQKAAERYEKRYNRMLSEHLSAVEDEELKDMFDTEDADLKDDIAKEVASRKETEDPYASDSESEGRKVYKLHRTYIDLAEDILLKDAEVKAKESGDLEREKYIKDVRRDISSVMKHLADKEYAKEALEEIRKMRGEAIRELGLVR